MTILLKSNLRVYLQRRKEHNWCRCLPLSGPVWYFPRTIYNTLVHEPETENFPAAQYVQVSAPDWYFPAPHSEQEKAPAAEIQPASQATYSVEPADHTQNLVSSFVLMWRQETGKFGMKILLKSNLRVYLQRRKNQQERWCTCLAQSGIFHEHIVRILRRQRPKSSRARTSGTTTPVVMKETC